MQHTAQQIPLLSVLLLVAFLAGCGANPASERERVLASEIEGVLAEDVKTTEGAESVAQVVQRMRAIDISGCPKDFQSAYLSHIHAWELAASVERDVAAFSDRYESWGAMLESFLRGVIFDFGMATEARDEAQRLRVRWEEADREVHQTFQRVEQLAIHYGANLPRPTN